MFRILLVFVLLLGLFCREAGAAGRQMDLTLPLYLAPEQLVGDVSVRIDENANVMLHSDSLLPLLHKLLMPELYGRIAALPAVEGFWTLDAVAGVGIGIDYDPARVALMLTLTAEQQKAETVSLAGQGGTVSGTPLALARQNTILTLRGRALHISEDPTADTGWDPFTLNIQGAQRLGQLGNVVLEGDAFFQDRSPAPWQRGGVRAVYDLPDDAIRLSAGDILPSTTGFQGNGNFMGLGINRNYGALQPERVIRPTGNQSFLIERRATIDVFVNDVRTRQIILDPGRYTLTDLVFVSGASSVRLEITDDAGNRQSLSFDAFSDPNLLQAGIVDFGINGGFLAETHAAGRTYAADDRISTSFVRYGVNDALTAGVNLQTRSRDSRTLIGGDVALGTAVGIWSLVLAHSDDSSGARGHSSTLGYAFATNNDQGSNNSFDVALTTTSALFGDVFTDAPANTIARDFNVRWRHLLPDGRALSLSSRYGAGRDETADQWDNTATMSRGMLIGRIPLSAQLSLNASEGQDSSAVYGIFFSFSVNFGDRGQVQGSYNSMGDTASATWYGQNGYGVDTLNGRASLRRDNTTDSTDGAVRYQGNRFNLGAEHRVDFTGQRIDARRQQSSLDFETSLVQADGRFAWGRPVSDSFTLIDAHPNLQGHALAVNQTEYGARAISDAFGPPLYGEVWSYRPNQIRVDANSLPPGYALPDTVFTAHPAYRSGMLLPFGSAANLSATGQLVDTDGTPIGLAAGNATALDAESPLSVPFFTNRRGRFALQGLVPGRYRLILNTTPRRTGTVVIAPTATLHVPLGILHLEEDR